MAKLITVKAAKEDHRVVLSETLPDHISKDNPTGEVWVAGNGRTAKVARTVAVERLLRSGALVEVNEVVEKVASVMPGHKSETTKAG